MLLAVVAEADVELDVVVEVIGLVVYDGVHVAACVGCAAGASCRRGCGGRRAGAFESAIFYGIRIYSTSADMHSDLSF